MKIRTAQIEDVESISSVYARSWKAAYPGIVSQRYLDDLSEDFWVEAFRQWIAERTYFMDVITENDTIIGSIVYGQSRPEGEEYDGEIISLYVAPEYFCQEYGRALLHYALRKLERLQAENADSYQRVILWVAEKNQRAISFYRRCGFLENGNRMAHPIGGMDVDYIQMEIDLPRKLKCPFCGGTMNMITEGRIALGKVNELSDRPGKYFVPANVYCCQVCNYTAFFSQRDQRVPEHIPQGSKDEYVCQNCRERYDKKLSACPKCGARRLKYFGGLI